MTMYPNNFCKQIDFVYFDGNASGKVIYLKSKFFLSYINN